MKRDGILVVISGPSGSGKGSVISKLEVFNGVAVSVSATTRKPRDFERDGVDYFFISREKFKELIEKNDMVEYNEYCGNLYGTIKSELKKLLKENETVILEIDVNGAFLIAKNFSCVRVFLLPPSFEELKKRLCKRGTETKEVVEKRLEEAKNEIKRIYEYDYLVINDDIEKAVEKIRIISKAESLKVERAKGELDRFFKYNF